jgi:hypothetical protein
LSCSFILTFRIHSVLFSQFFSAANIACKSLFLLFPYLENVLISKVTLNILLYYQCYLP